MKRIILVSLAVLVVFGALAVIVDGKTAEYMSVFQSGSKHG